MEEGRYTEWNIPIQVHDTIALTAEEWNHLYGSPLCKRCGHRKAFHHFWAEWQGYTCEINECACERSLFDWEVQEGAYDDGS